MGADEQDRWLRGSCHVLSLALHRQTGWPIMSLHDGRISNSRMAMDEPGMLVHSGVVRPDEVFIDARGIIGMSDLGPVEDEYVHYPEIWARWMRSDCGAFDVDDFRESIPLGDEKLETALADARALVADRLQAHLTGFPISPVPDAGQIMTAEDSPDELRTRHPADPDGPDDLPF